MLKAPSEEAALEQLHEAGLTDGLPVVIPTAERVARLVVASGLPAEQSLGVMGPCGLYRECREGRYGRGNGRVFAGSYAGRGGCSPGHRSRRF